MSESEADFLEITFVDESKSEKKTKRAQKVTDHVITPFEYTKILECRAKQLYVGYPPLIEWEGNYDPIAIAKREIEQRLSTLLIVRRIHDPRKPQGFREEVWSLKNLDLRDF
jgi:DNA-directed RNA polymerase subunit K/omega